MRPEPAEDTVETSLPVLSVEERMGNGRLSMNEDGVRVDVRDRSSGWS